MPSDTPFSELAQVNPRRPALDLRDLDPVSFIPMGNVSESGRWAEQQLRPYGEVRRGYAYCAEGDVLFAKITPCTENGKGCHAIGLTNGVGFASTEFHVLRAKEGVDPGYVFQWSVNLPLRLNAAAQMTGSAGQRRVPAAFFSRFTVPELPLAEQSKIAEVLSTVDRAVEETEALIAKQQRIKTGLMQDLLTRGVDERGNLRSEQTHKFKDSPLGRIPVEWAVSSIGAEFDIQLGKMLSQASRQSRSSLPYLGNKNVQWGNVDLTKLERMDFDEGERKKFRLKSDDILVCEGGEVGRTCVWRGELEECFYQKAIHRLRPKRDYIPSLFPTYMRWAVRSGLLSDFTSQSSIAHLTKEKLAGVPMCVPSESEQMRISDAMEAIDRELKVHRQQLAKLRALKHGLMQDLLTGKRRVTALLEQRKKITT